MIKLARLTNSSEEKFRTLCALENSGQNLSNLQLFDKEEIEIDIDENKKFNNKFELGEYLYQKLNNISLDNKIWHFLTLVYHQQLLKNEKIGEIDRFCIDSTKTFYPFTHLLKPVFDLYNFYNQQPELIKFLLLNPVNESGGTFLEIVKRQDTMKNENFIKVSKKIFYNNNKQELKSGNREGVLRLITLFYQYERTYDLYSMPADIILKKLISKHAEFDRFN